MRAAPNCTATAFPSPCENAMRILVAIAHYYKYDRIGFHGSRGNDPTPRIRALTNSIVALHGHFTGPSLEYSFGEGKAMPANGERHQLTIAICTTENEHVVDRLDLDRNLFLHHKSATPPLELAIECRRVLGNSVDNFDLLCFLEDDLVINDPTFFEKILWFNSQVGDGSVLLPNRYEISVRHRFRKVYCDGPINRNQSPRYWNDKGPPLLASKIMNRDVKFQLASNVHAGCYFVTQRQMKQWKQAPWFLTNEQALMGPLESAASVALMRSFAVYKPALENADFLEIQHDDDRFMRYFSGEPINKVNEEDKESIGQIGEG
jgi:hypothetical protein